MSVAKMKDGKRWYVFVRYKDWTTGTINYCHGDYNSVLRSQGSTYLTKGNRPDLTIWTVFFYAFSTCQQRLTVLK